MKSKSKFYKKRPLSHKRISSWVIEKKKKKKKSVLI